ncbi:MAG: hypothetical protein ABR502_03045 [Chitinophagaceae bacterium]
MKHLTTCLNLKNVVAFLTLLLIQTVMFAQDTGGGTGGEKEGGGGVNVNIRKEGGDWYTQPWVWIVGGALFLLLLIALLRGNSGADRTGASRTDRVTVTKTRDTDTDTDVV